MRALLTGVTGNLGFEICKILLERKHTPVLLVRSNPKDAIKEKIEELYKTHGSVPVYAFVDLEKEVPQFNQEIDVIIHSAGVVHFLNAGESNTKMAANITNLAESRKIPLYYVSTAYLYKPNGEPFNNQYEIDKQKAKEIVSSSSTNFAIISPSIIIGNSKTGEIMNFSGYYTILGSILKAISKSESVVRFPKFSGFVNVVPADFVAETIVDVLESGKFGDFYATNPTYTTFEKIIGKSLEIVGLRQRFEFLDISIEEYRAMELSDAEKKLLTIAEHFIPYWIIQYKFPDSITKNSFSGQEDLEIMIPYFLRKVNEGQMEK